MAGTDYTVDIDSVEALQKSWQQSAATMAKVDQADRKSVV